MAKGLLEALRAKWGLQLEVVAEAKGAQLEGAKYRHPLVDRESPVVIGGDYITTESGTGLVHTAPGHGQEDYLTGMKYGLPLLSPVDGDGKFTAEAGEEFAGKAVLSDGTEAVVRALEREGCLVLEEAYKHKYPYDWRTKQPTIFRATEQWFASVEGFREAALGAVSSVEWVPAVGEKRITVRRAAAALVACWGSVGERGCRPGPGVPFRQQSVSFSSPAPASWGPSTHPPAPPPPRSRWWPGATTGASAASARGGSRSRPSSTRRPGRC